MGISTRSTELVSLIRCNTIRKMTDDKAVDIHFDLVSCTPRIGISYMILFVRESRQVRQWLWTNSVNPAGQSIYSFKSPYCSKEPHF